MAIVAVIDDSVIDKLFEIMRRKYDNKAVDELIKIYEKDKGQFVADALYQYTEAHLSLIDYCMKNDKA